VGEIEKAKEGSGYDAGLGVRKRLFALGAGKIFSGGWPGGEVRRERDLGGESR